MSQTPDTDYPRGFAVHTGHAGIVDDGRDDFTVLVSTEPAVSAAMFTKSRFAGPCVVLSRDSMAAGSPRGVVVLARNANVATGELGRQDAVLVRSRVATTLGLTEDDLVICSTGVIGRRYPMPAVSQHLDELRWPFDGSDFAAASRAIMTTDTRPKLHTAAVGDARIVGIAKGVGMLEPDMATMLTFICTDAELTRDELEPIFRRVVERTFNSVSVDTDTSTSDTAVVIANGVAGPVDLEEFERGLYDVCLALIRDIASDGEGASTLIQVHVTGARDDSQAKRVGKTVVNSPLVKTMVHGADPNWGRVTMAIGKNSDDLDIDPDKVSIGFGGTTVFPQVPSADDERAVVEHLRGDVVDINIDLGIGPGRWTVYGCDLTEGYIRINADYTT